MSNSITVSSPTSLDAPSLVKIKTFAKKKYGLTTDVKQIIDKSLIAGFVININGIEHDYSVTGMLSRLSQSI